MVGIIPNVQTRKLGFKEATYHSVKRCWRENLSLHLSDFKVLTLVMIPYCFSDEWKMCQRKEKNPGGEACYSGQFKQLPTEEYNLEHSQHRQGKKRENDELPCNIPGENQMQE